MNQMASQAGPMTRMAGYPGGKGLRGDDSHGRITPRGENGDDMKGDMAGMDMGGTKGMDMSAPKPTGDPAIPAASLGAGAQATAPDGPLANTHLDAGMMGMMQEQNKKGPNGRDLSKCEQRPELSPGRVHGRSDDEHGQAGREA